MRMTTDSWAPLLTMRSFRLVICRFFVIVTAMKLKIDLEDFRVPDGKKPFKLHKVPTKVKPLYKDAQHYEALLGEFRAEINDLQQMMFAHNRYGMLFIFQAMDAAGKDGTIKHVMSGINPQGCEVHSFKAPSSEDLDHDFLWRSSRALPERGRIGIFNRSYYEEVLVVRVHKEILAAEKLPEKLVTKHLWKERFEDIRAYEQHLARNGTVVLKFFLHVSKKEQKKRFLARLDEPAKNWKFSAGDLKERTHWDDYQNAYEEMIQETATPEAPWYVVPADNKWYTHLMVASAIVEALDSLDLRFPIVTDEQRTALQEARKALSA